MKKYLLVFALVSSIVLIHPFLQAETDLVKRARRSMDYMSYEQAAGLLQQALAKKPKQKGVRIHLAYAYFRMGKAEKAIQILNEELLRFPDSFNAYILLGYIHFSSGQYEDAAGTCRDFEAGVAKAVDIQARKDGVIPSKQSRLDIFSRNRQYFVGKIDTRNSNLSLPYFILGLSYKRSGDLKKAANYFQYSLEWGYDPVKCLIQLIDIDLIQKDWKKARWRSQAALAAEGPQAEFNFLMGYAHHQLGETEDAAEFFRKSIELKPFLTEALENLAKIYISQGEFKKAAPHLQRALKMGGLNQEVYVLLKEVSATEPKKIDKTQTKLNKKFVDEIGLKYKYEFSVDVNTVVYGINTSALDLIKAGRINAAENWMKKFLEIFEYSPELNYNLAKLYELKNSLGNALKYAWRAKELKKDYKDAYDLVASIFFELEDYETSADFYQQAITFDPQDAMSHFNLGCVFFAMKDYGKAERHWRDAIKNEQKIKQEEEKDKTSQKELKIDITVKAWPVSFEAHKSLGHLYLRKNVKEQALEEFIKAIELEPQDPGPYFEAGKIYWELNDKTSATTYFDKYIYMGGDEEKVKEIIEFSYYDNICLFHYCYHFPKCI